MRSNRSSSALAFFVEHKLVTFILAALWIGAGLYVAPFSGLRDSLSQFPSDPVAVDAIPDIGENQQIVFTRWDGRSPRDIEDQVTYPLTTALLGVPGVRTVRSSSMFGISSIYIIFEEDIDFYWSRARILEKLASLSSTLLPEGVAPKLGPDATGLGQVYWYTLDGLDAKGDLVGGWDLHELRSIQDWQVRYALQSVPGVAEVASVGGHVREYHIDINPEALLANKVTLSQVAAAVRGANLDVGARTLEINQVEYIVRGLGLIKSAQDLEQTVVASRENTPIRIADIAQVTIGPAERRGALDDAGGPSVGGVVVARYGENPMEVLTRLKEKIAEIAPGLPKRTLEDGTVSQVSIVPFYDRSELIEDTLGTLSSALWQQILITAIVILVIIRNLRSSALVVVVLPLGVIATLVAMKLGGVDANIMALAGIAIAIGTMVDIGIVIVENITAHIEDAPEGPRHKTIITATREVAPAVITSVFTTILSFLPVFALTASEGKLFIPLAFTKTFAMAGALLAALLVVPALAHLFYRRAGESRQPAWLKSVSFPGLGKFRADHIALALIAIWLLTSAWLPLGESRGLLINLLFVVLVVTLVLGAVFVFERFYEPLLRWSLAHKGASLVGPALLICFALLAWRGFDTFFGWLPSGVRSLRPVAVVAGKFPKFQDEFMPPFDEGVFLYMPTTMPHASLGQAREMLEQMDAAIASVPEVDRVVGKLGRADSPLDPAPISMFETVVTYHPEFITDKNGDRVRQWRDHIRSPDDIWDEIAAAARTLGLTPAPKQMPIATRIVMLQSGMRAPVGLKIRGPSLELIEKFGREVEPILREVPGIDSETVIADRTAGKAYLNIEIDRQAIGRYGLSIEEVQRAIAMAVGGHILTRTVEGRERYAVRVRYMREERDSIEAIESIYVSTGAGQQIPLRQLAKIHYERGPQVIRAEDTFLTSYVTFSTESEVSEVEAVERAERAIERAIDQGRLYQPDGVSFRFAGTYESQLRSERDLSVLVPLAIALIFLVLYLQFRRVSTALIIFSGVVISVAGAFVLLWFYGRPWFFNVELFGVQFRDLFQIGTVHLSVAVWVGVIALIGIATDAGVVMATYIAQRLEDHSVHSPKDIRECVTDAALRRLRPCLLTTATTVLALVPVLTAQGKGADVMLPMALPSVGGMGAVLLTLFTVPVLYAWVEERRLSSTE